MFEPMDLTLTAQELVLENLYPHTFPMGDGELTASDPNGPVIIQLGSITYKAYRQMSGLDLSSSGPPEKGLLYFRLPYATARYLGSFLFGRQLTGATLKSSAGQPLQLDPAQSFFPQTKSELTLQMYTGTLDMTWTTSGPFIPQETESSPVQDVRLQVSYYAGQPEVSGTLVGKLQQPILGEYENIYLVADSESPLQAGQEPPLQASYPVRNVRLHLI